MSDEAVYHDAPKTQEYGQTTAPTATVKVEPESEPETIATKTRGLFGFLGKKKEEETKYEETPITKEEEKKYEETPISSSEYESEPKTQEYGHTTATNETQEYGQTAPAPITHEYDQTTPKTHEYDQTTDAPITEEYSQTTPKTHDYDQTTADPITEEYGQTTPKPREYDQTTADPITEEYGQTTTAPITEEYDQTPPKTHDYGQTTTAPITEEYGQTTLTDTEKVEPEYSESVEKEDRGMFDFLGKKKEEENKYEDTTPIPSSDYEQKDDHVSETEPKSEEQPETLFQKMHISHSNSGSDQEDEDLTEQLKEKIEERKERKEEEETIKNFEDDNSVPIEKYEEVAVAPPPYNTDVGTHAPTDVVHHDHLTSEPQEKKGLMEKIKEKLPGHKKPVVEEEYIVPPSPTTVAPVVVEEEPEKRGIIGKIKDKIKGNHSKSSEEEKEKPKESY